MSIAYKDQLVYEALQDMDKYRQEQEVIFQRIREKKKPNNLVFGNKYASCVMTNLTLMMKSEFSGSLKTNNPT